MTLCPRVQFFLVNPVFNDCYKLDAFSIPFSTYGLEKVFFFVHRMQVLTSQVKNITAKLVSANGFELWSCINHHVFIAYLFESNGRIS